MKKIKLFLAALAAMVGLSANAQSWTAPTIQGEDPVAGTQYKVMNVGAGMFLDMGKAWFGWSTTAILSSSGINFTLTADGDNWKFIRIGKQGVFTSGNSIAGDAMHVDNTAHTYGITKLSNGYYHIHDTGGDASSTCWGYNSSFHATGVVAHADASASGWNCEWVFIQPANLDIYKARLQLYNTYLVAVSEGASTDDAATVYNNSNATVEQLNAANTALNQTRYQHKLDIASNESPQDITEFVLKNADFSAGNITGWETNYVSGVQAQNIGYQGASYSNGGVTISKFIEAWRPGATLGDGYLRQTVNGLPEGKYLLEADAIATWQDDASRVVTGSLLYIEASGVTYSTKMATGNGKPEHFSTQFLSPGNVDVTFGLKTVSSTANWICADNFKVVFYGIDLSPYATLLANAVTAAQAYTSSNTTTGAYNAIQTALTTYNKEWSSSAEYTTAIAAIQAVTDNAAKLQAMRTSGNYATVRTNVLALEEQTTKFTDRSGDDSFNALEAAVEAQDEAFDALASLDGVDQLITNLRKAASTFAGSVSLIKGQYLDLTDAMLYNAAMRETGGLSLWTIAENTNEAYPKYNGSCSEFYQANFDFYQIAPQLPVGNYNIEVSAFHRAGTYHTYLYANDDEILVLPITNGENSMAEAAASFDQGLYINSLKITLEAATDVQIGFKNLDGKTGEGYDYSADDTDKWTIFRDFKIKFFGDDALAVYREEYEAALTAATEALSNATYTNVAGTERSNLSTAVTETYPKSVVETDETQEKFETATSALTELTTTFKNSVTSWNNYVTTLASYKAEADLFDESIYTGTTLTQPASASEISATLVTNRKELNVAVANYVGTNYKYSLTSKIGDFSTWTATATAGEEADTPQTNSNQHWSGTTRDYYEQGKNGWASETGFTGTYTKTCTLPAGNYVIKVAARASGGVTGTLISTATENSIDMPNYGASSKGIDKSGAANFGEGEFANEGTGFGWEWRFLPFNVAADDTEVTITIYMSTTGQYNWFSLADAELLSDEDKTTQVALSESADATSTITSNDGELATVTMTRTIKTGFNTVVLPFDLTAVQVAAMFGTGSEVYAYTESSSDPNNVTINFNKVAAGTISANVPVLVKAITASKVQVVAGVTIVAPGAETGAKVAGTNFDFVGSYEPLTIEAGDWFIGDGALYKSAGSTNLKAFRAYLQDKSAETSVKALTLVIDGLTTGIATIENGKLNVEEGAIYNVAGQRLNKLQKGINIVNGKKYLVK